MSLLCVLFSLSLLLACGGRRERPGSADGGVVEIDAGLGISPPAPVARPTFLPCPAGWREVADSEARDDLICDPWPEGGPGACATGEVQFPGEASCGPIGAACGLDGWPTEVPPSGAIYVRVGSLSGTGSRAAPLGSISEALAGARAGTVIVLSEGRHRAPSPLTVPAGVEIRGACAGQTVLSTADLYVETPNVVIRDLGLEAKLSVFGAATLNLQGVAFDGSPGTAMVIFEGQVTGRRVVVRQTEVLADVPPDRSGIGIIVIGESGERPSVDFDQLLLEGNRRAGVFLAGTATGAFARVLVRDTSSYLGEGGFAFAVEDGAQAQISQSVFLGSRQGAVRVSGAGADATFDHVLIADTTRDGVDGASLLVLSGARASVTHLRIERGTTQGIAAGAGTTLTGNDILVRDTAQPGWVGAVGLFCEGGTQVNLERLSLIRTSPVGLVVNDLGTQVQISDLSILATKVDVDRAFGDGIAIQNGGAATITRAIIDESADVGVLVSNGSSITLHDAIIRRTRSRDVDGYFGRGMFLQGGSTAQVERLRLEGNMELGLGSESPGTTLNVSDLVVRDTIEQITGLRYGRGLTAQDGAHVVAQRVRIENNRDVGVLAIGPEAVLEVLNLWVSDTRAAQCGLDCNSVGIGLSAVHGGYLRATGFEIRGNELIGVQIAESGTMDLVDGLVTGHEIGANVQTAGFDEARISAGVTYSDNALPFESSSQPVPDPLPHLVDR